MNVRVTQADGFWSTDDATKIEVEFHGQMIDVEKLTDTLTWISNSSHLPGNFTHLEINQIHRKWAKHALSGKSDE